MGLYGMLVVTAAPGGRRHHRHGVSGRHLQRRCPLLLSEIDPVQNIAVDEGGHPAGIQRDHRMVRAARRLRKSRHAQCRQLLSAGGQLHAAVLPDQRRRVRQDPRRRLAVPGRTRDAVSPERAGALGERRACACTCRRSSVHSRATASGGFSLIAEDGNPLPGVPRVQSEVFMAAGKTYDVMINVPATGTTALPIYDRELSLSGNSTARDAGMLAYIGVNGAALPAGRIQRDRHGQCGHLQFDHRGQYAHGREPRQGRHRQRRRHLHCSGDHAADPGHADPRRRRHVHLRGQ